VQSRVVARDRSIGGGGNGAPVASRTQSKQATTKKVKSYHDGKAARKAKANVNSTLAALD
jgi:hypothetical protein